LILLRVGYHYSKWSKKAYVLGKAFAISIEPTTSCNLRCPQCPSGLRQFTRPIGMLNLDVLENLLSEIKKHVFSINFYFQGEPYLNPAFTDMISLANKRGLYTITSTNAHYLNENNCEATIKSGLDELVVSLDGVTQEVYEQYRIGGNLNKTIEGIKRMVDCKRKLKSKTPFIFLQFVVFQFNEHQVEDVKKLGRALGVDKVKIKTAQLYDFREADQLVPQNPIYSRYERIEGGNWRIKNQLKNECWRMWQGCVITWDGKLVPCCFDKDAQYQLGDVTRKTFNEVWTSAEYTNFRNTILKGRKEIDICQNCTEGTRVWA